MADTSYAIYSISVTVDGMVYVLPITSGLPPPAYTPYTETYTPPPAPPETEPSGSWSVFPSTETFSDTIILTSASAYIPYGQASGSSAEGSGGGTSVNAGAGTGGGTAPQTTTQGTFSAFETAETLSFTTVTTTLSTFIPFSYAPTSTSPSPTPTSTSPSPALSSGGSYSLFTTTETLPSTTLVTTASSYIPSGSLHSNASGSWSVFPTTETEISTTFVTSASSYVTLPNGSYALFRTTETLPSTTITTSLSSFMVYPTSTLVPVTLTTSGVTTTSYFYSVIPPASSSHVPYTTLTMGSSLTTLSSLSALPSGTNLPANGQFPTNSSGTVPVCAGQGMDSDSIGVLSSFVLSALVGLLLWLVFAFIRPRFPQIFAVREWFPPTSSRAPPLGNSFFAFLFPSVPILPSIRMWTLTGPPPDTAFPSDEQLSQRMLYIALRVVLGWSLLGIVACIPLYVVDTPCLGQTGQLSFYTGRLSSLTDLSVIRLLEMLDADNAGSLAQYPSQRRSLLERDIPGEPSTWNIRARLIVLAFFVLVLALLPALWHLCREFGKLKKFKAAWDRYRCGGLEMAWLSAEKAPGLQGWNEGRLRAMLVRVGLGEGEEEHAARRRRNGNGNGNGNTEEEQTREVDVQSVFTVVDTLAVRDLIRRRDAALQALEVAETRYIFSFRLAGPSQVGSDADLRQPQPGLGGEKSGAPAGSLVRRNSGRSRVGSPRGVPRELPENATPSTTSRQLSPTPQNFLAPATFYKLPPAAASDAPSAGTAEEWEGLPRRIVGTRFQELTHHTGEPFAIGSRIKIGTSGELRAVSPDPHFGPNDPGGTHGDDEYAIDEETPAAVPTGTSLSSSGPAAGPSRVGPSRSQRSTLSKRGRSSWLSSGRGAKQHNRESSGSAEPLTGWSGREKYAHERVRSDESAETSAEPASVPLQQEAEVPGTTTVPSGPVHEASFSGQSQAAAGAAEEPRSSVEGNVPYHVRVREPQPSEGRGRPLSHLDHDDLGEIYSSIKQARTELKLLNTQIEEAQQEAFQNIARGERVRGWLLVGRGLRYLEGVQMIEGRSREDVRWDELQSPPSMGGNLIFWTLIGIVGILLAIVIIPVAGLALSDAPDFSHVLPFLDNLTSTSIGPALAITLAPAVAASLFVLIAVSIVTYAAKYARTPSVFGKQFLAFRATFLILTVIACIWLVVVSAVMFGIESFTMSWNQPGSVADGSVYIAVLCLTVILNLACIAPALLLLNPWRFWKVRAREKKAVTPRQRFRAMYPHMYNPAHATSFCVVGIVFAATFTLLFPLIGPAIVLLLLLSLVAHRFIIGYVYERGSQTGGILQLWVMRRFLDLLALQPILLGLLLLSRTEWEIAGVSLGCGVLLLLFVELYTSHAVRHPPKSKLQRETRASLHAFQNTIHGRGGYRGEEEESLVAARGGPAAASESRHRPGIRRGSVASILDMMAVTLAVMQPSRRSRPVPLPSETIDDLVSTAQAAQTHPNAPEQPPTIGPLATHFEDPAEETAGLLYPPELLAPVPIVWLPDDGEAGVAHAEAYDLQRYHGLLTILDVIPSQRTRTRHERSK